MFERFTERARQSVVLAQDEARNLNHNYIGTEHLLLGLVREAQGHAAYALSTLGVTADSVREQLVNIMGRGDETPTAQIPFTPRSKLVMELALREALGLGCNYIGTEHVLLALVRENGGTAIRILNIHGADGPRIRNEIMRLLAGPNPVKKVPIREPVDVEKQFGDLQVMAYAQGFRAGWDSHKAADAYAATGDERVADD